MGKNAGCLIIILLCLSLCFNAAALDTDSDLFMTFYPDDQKLPDKNIGLITIFVQEVIPLNGIYKEDSLRFSGEIKQTLFNMSVFEIRELTDKGMKIWPAEKIAACEETDCLSELGKLLRVEKIIQAKVGKFGRNYSLSLAVFNVKEGSYGKTISKGCSCIGSDFVALLNQSVLELLNLNLQ